MGSGNAYLIGQSDARLRLDTPCLVVDLPALQRNIGKMMTLCRTGQIALRPHAKAHKCANIGAMQVSVGASGLCVATVGEAEALVEAGLRDLHLTSTLASQGKIARLAELVASGAAVSCVVDCLEMVQAFARAARAYGVRFELLVDVDMGRHRAGVSTDSEALTLARRISDDPQLRFGGIQAYAGHLSHVRSFEERKRQAADAGSFIQRLRDGLSRLTQGPLRITGGSTGSFMLDIQAGLFTELQCGSYVFMDTEYRAVDLDGRQGSLFEPALFLQSCVISNRHAGFVTTDGGDKRLASKYGEPPSIVRGAPAGSTYRSLSDEHGQITLPPGSSLPLDARIECVVPHCDPTVNLFDALHVVQREELVAIWPVTARGS